jgi:uncharacterized protein (TIGR03437 family)
VGIASIDVFNANNVTFSNTVAFSINAAPSNRPSISGLSPSSVAAGGPAFGLVVNGSGFATGLCMVQWNGSPLPTNDVSGTEVIAAVPASLITMPGNVNITVSCQGTSGGTTLTSNTVTFLITAATASTPAITSISPSSTTAGGPAFSLVVNGSGFVAQSIVHWNGSSLATTYVSSTQLTAPVPTNLIAIAGTATISVVNPGNSTSNTVAFNISAPNTYPTITTPAALPLGTVGMAYSDTLAASGGKPPYSWSVTSGALPNGLTLSSSGTIAGVPTSAGTANFTVQVSDSSAETASVVFSLTISAANSSQPVINPGGVISIAGPVPWPGLTPMGWVSIYGNHLSNTTRSWTAADFSGNNLPTEIDGVTVSIDGKPGYISYVSPNMINLQVPNDSKTGMVPVTVTNNGFTSAPVMVDLTACAPAFKTFGQYVAALHADGSVVAPAGMFPGSTPAAAGEVISLWGVGWGPTNPPRSAGQLVDAAPLADLSELSITIGGVAVAVPYAALAAGAGLYQFNVTVPPSLGTGNWPVAGSMWGYDTQTGVFLPVK